MSQNINKKKVKKAYRPSKIDPMAVVWWQRWALDVRHLQDALHLCAEATIRTNSGPIRHDEATNCSLQKNKNQIN